MVPILFELEPFFLHWDYTLKNANLKVFKYILTVFKDLLEL